VVYFFCTACSYAALRASESQQVYCMLLCRGICSISTVQLTYQQHGCATTLPLLIRCAMFYFILSFCFEFSPEVNNGALTCKNAKNFKAKFYHNGIIII